MTEKDLRVLLISPLPPPAGGIATWTKQYIDWASSNSLNVDIVNTAVVGKRAEKINSGTKLVDEIQRTKNIIKELKYKINKCKPNVIHLNTPCGKLGIIRDYMCAKIAKRYNAKLFVHYRCNIEDQIGDGIVQKYFFNKLVNIADLNLVLNNSSKSFLFSETHKDSTLITNFIEEKFILQETKIVKEVIKVISFVGHVQRTKGILEIIDVAKQFPEIDFKLAGPVANEIINLNLPSNITLLGAISKNEVRELLEKSDLFLFPSYTEGFANALLEAMAMGLPIITTPVGANCDMIESSGGIVVSVANSVEVVNAINLLKDSSKRIEISRWNINKVKEEYSTEKVMKKLISLYRFFGEDKLN